MFTLYDQIMAEHAAIADGQNADFERVAKDLERFGLRREELIGRTAFTALPAYRWITKRSAQMETERPLVTETVRRLQYAAQRLKVQPTFTPTAVTELDLVLRYLAGIPTLGALRTWRRKVGLNRRGDDLWKLRAWTSIARALVEYLRDEQTAATKRRIADARLEEPHFAERYAHELLHARYPDIVHPDWRKLSHRVNR